MNTTGCIIAAAILLLGGMVVAQEPPPAEADRPTAETQKGVKAGLAWLAAHQNPEGGWSCAKFNRNCAKEPCGGAGSLQDHDAGITGLALLAFLGAGNTHQRGEHKKVVLAAVKALKALQGADGCFGPHEPSGGWFYDHAICTLAAAEAYGLTGGSKLLGDPFAKPAVAFLLSCQNPGMGWRYGVKPGDNDSSCTAWALTALKSAKISRIDVPKEAFDGGLAWLDKATDKKSFRTGYISAGDQGSTLAESAGRYDQQEAMTAAAIASRIFALGPAAMERPDVKGAIELVRKKLPSWDEKNRTVDYYYWYWGSLAMFQAGGEAWEEWRTALEKTLLPGQKTEGCEAGSWDPVDPWGGAAGRVYATAINTLTLEVFYRYGRVTKNK